MFNEDSQSEMTSADDAADRRSAHKTKTQALFAGLAVALLAAGWGGAELVIHGSSASDAISKQLRLTTATVRRTDLVTTKSYSGSLLYPSLGSVHISGGGTVTSVLQVGYILAQGASLLAVDDEPVGVLFGSTPLYRTLGMTDTTDQRLAVESAQAGLLAAQAILSGATDSPQESAASASSASTGAGQPAVQASGASSAATAAAVAQDQVGVALAQQQLTRAEQALEAAATPQSGPDVQLVADNLAALGFFHGSTDTWTTALQSAVRQWQGYLGASTTGEIDPTQVIVVPSAARVSAIDGQVGDTASAVTILLSSPSKEATFHLRAGAPPETTST